MRPEPEAHSGRAATPREQTPLHAVSRPESTTGTSRSQPLYGGFPSLPAYLRGYALVGRVLEPLEGLRAARVRIIAADDDPIIPAADLERIARPPVLEVTRTRHGGHCGYFDGVTGPTWVERQILATFESA